MLSSPDSLPLDWSLPNESPSDGLSLGGGGSVHIKDHKLLIMDP